MTAVLTRTTNHKSISAHVYCLSCISIFKYSADDTGQQMPPKRLRPTATHRASSTTTKKKTQNTAQPSTLSSWVMLLAMKKNSISDQCKILVKILQCKMTVDAFEKKSAGWTDIQTVPFVTPLTFWHRKIALALNDWLTRLQTGCCRREASMVLLKKYFSHRRGCDTDTKRTEESPKRRGTRRFTDLTNRCDFCHFRKRFDFHPKVSGRSQRAFPLSRRCCVFIQIGISPSVLIVVRCATKWHSVLFRLSMRTN